MEKHSEETGLCSSEFEQNENVRDQGSLLQARSTNAVQQSTESTTEAEGSHESSEKSTRENRTLPDSGSSEKAEGAIETEGSSESSEKASGGTETESSSGSSDKFGEKKLIYIEEDAMQGFTVQYAESDGASETQKQTVRMRTDSGMHADTPPPPIMDIIEPQSSSIRSEDSESLRSLERGENVLEVVSTEAKVELKSNVFVFKCFKSQLNYNFFKGLVEHLCSDFSANIIGNVRELCKSIARFLLVHSSMPSLQTTVQAEEGQICFKYSPDELLKLLASLEDVFRRNGFPDIANFFQIVSELSKSGKTENEKIKVAVCELQKCLCLLADQDRCVEQIKELCRSYDVFPHEPPDEDTHISTTSSELSLDNQERNSDHSGKEDVIFHDINNRNEDSQPSKIVYESPESPSPERDSGNEETPTPICGIKLRFSGINYYNLYFPFVRYFLPRMNCLVNIDDILNCISDFLLNQSLECLEIKREPSLISDLKRWDIVCNSNNTLNLIELLHILLREMGLLRFADILSYLLESRRAYISMHPESSTDEPHCSREPESDLFTSHAGRHLKSKIESSVKSFPRTPSLMDVSESLSRSTASFMDPGLEDTSWNKPITHTRTSRHTPDVLGSPEFASIEGKVIAIFITRPTGSRTPFCKFMREYFERYQDLNSMDEVFKFIANFILSNSKWKALKDEAEARELMQRQGIDQVFFWRSRDVFHLIREAETFFRGQSYTLLANFFNRLIAQELARREGREYRYDNDSMRYEHEQAGRNVVTFISSIKMIETLHRIYSALCEFQTRQSISGDSQIESHATESSLGSNEESVQASYIQQYPEPIEHHDAPSECPEDPLAIMSSQIEASRQNIEGPEASEPNSGRIGNRYYITDYHLVPEFATYFLHHERSISQFSRVFKLIAEFLFHISRQYIFSVAEELKLEFFSRQDKNISVMIEFLHTFLKDRGLKIFANLVEALILRYKEERAIQSAFGAQESESDSCFETEIDFRSVGIIKKEILNALGEFLLVGEGSQELSVLYDQYVNVVSPEPSAPLSESEDLSAPGTSGQSSTSAASDRKVIKPCSSPKASGIFIRLDSSVTDGQLLSRLSKHLDSASMDGTNLSAIIQAVVDFFHYKMGSDILGDAEECNVLEEAPGSSRILYVQTPISNFNFIFVLENFLRNNGLHLTASVLLLLMEYVRVNETFFAKVSRVPPETLDSQSELDAVEWRYFLAQSIHTKIDILNMEERSSPPIEQRSSYKIPYKKKSKSQTVVALKGATGHQRPALKTKAELKLYETGVETTVSEMKRMRLSEASDEVDPVPEATTERTIGEIYEVAYSQREDSFKESCYAELEKLEKSTRAEEALDNPEASEPEVESREPTPSTSCPQSTKSVRKPEVSPEKGGLPQRRDRKRSQPQPEGEVKPPEQKMSKVSPKKHNTRSRGSTGSKE